MKYREAFLWFEHMNSYFDPLLKLKFFIDLD